MILLAPFFLLSILSLNAQTFNRVETHTNLSNISNNNGVAVADYDLDGDLDLFVVGNTTFDMAVATTPSRLFRNNNGVFEDVTALAGLNQTFNHSSSSFVMYDVTTGGTIPLSTVFGDKMGASWGDYNNDGYPDIFLTNAVQSQLYKNNGNGTFTNVTASAGFDETCTNCYMVGALWWDYNNDGNLDVFLCDQNYNSNSKLYTNNGNGNFTQLIKPSIDLKSNCFSAIPIDINNDNYLDLYVANDRSFNNFLFINQSGTDFVESAVTYGLEDPYDGMGLATSDYDNDGSFEILVTNIKQNGFYVNNGSNIYSNKASDNNIYDTDWAWGATFSDFNLDGFEDFYVTDGFMSINYNHYYKNTLNTFNQREFIEEDITQTSDLKTTSSRSVVAFDYDNDGDLDMVVSNFNDKLFFYENTTINSSNSSGTHNAWAKIKLKGTTSNKDALGSKIELTTNNGLTLYRLYHGSGYLSQSLQPVHFGLLNATSISSLKITWPTGLQETYTNIPINKTIEVTENTGFTLGQSDFSLPKFSMKVFPNPINNSSEITITNTKEDTVFSFFDLLGRKIPTQQIFNAGRNDTKIKTGHLSKGIYLLKSTNSSFKIVVN